MNKNMIWALVLLVLIAVILIINRGSVSVHLIVAKVDMLKAFAFLGFTAIGVLIGVLLK